MSEVKLYRKTAVQPMRPYVPGEDLSGVSVNVEDTPELGGMIAHNPKNSNDQWYVAKQFFEDNYEEVKVDRSQTVTLGGGWIINVAPPEAMVLEAWGLQDVEICLSTYERLPNGTPLGAEVRLRSVD